MAVAPPLLVDAQPRTPLPYGLFSVLTPRSGGDGHWQDGIQWEALSCDPADGIGDVSCDDDEPTIGLPKQFVDGGSLGSATPFVVYGSFACSPVGNSPDEAQAKAMAHLVAREEARVEQALWTGDLGNSGFAAGAAGVDAAAGDPATALGLLENWIGSEYGSLGVIHVTRAVATLLIEKKLVVAKGNGLFTVLGTPVVAGAGYPGTTPAGIAPAAGVGYIYATPGLLGYRSEPFPGVTPASAGFDRANNDMYAVAERTYVIGFDPCGSAVARVTLP